MNNSLISIIIPVYNSSLTIEETLSSVIAQSYPYWECIVVDDKSEDSTYEVIHRFQQQFSNIKYFKRTNSTKGVSTCRNIGVENAKGQYLLFLDSDDLLHKNCLKKRFRYTNVYPEYSFWIFKMQEFIHEVGDIQILHNNYPEVETNEEYLKLFLKGVNPFTVTCPLWKKKSLKLLKGFNEKLQLWEDPELHIRAILLGLKFEVNKSSKPDCYYRNDRESKKGLEKEFLLLAIVGLDLSKLK